MEAEMRADVRDAVEVRDWLARLSPRWTDEQRARFVLESVAIRIASQLEGRRRRRGVALQELAKRAGTSKAHVHRLLSGRYRGLTLRSLVRIAVALGCDVDVRIRERARRQVA